MDKELHEKALDAAVDAIFETALDSRGQMHSAIAAYLKTAGLTVVPVNPTVQMFKASMDALVPASDAQACYRAMLAAFPSPFDEVK